MGSDNHQISNIKKIITESNYVHGALEMGGCAGCHTPHASEFPKLLIASFPGNSYAHSSEKDFELCFSCHGRDLLMYPETSFSTDFRDGIRNLHYLHVTKGLRGRNCIVCHDVHGSDQPKLMAASADFGKWHMKIDFKKTETGGSCAPGCHRVKEYDRKN